MQIVIGAYISQSVKGILETGKKNIVCILINEMLLKQIQDFLIRAVIWTTNQKSNADCEGMLDGHEL